MKTANFRTLGLCTLVLAGLTPWARAKLYFSASTEATAAGRSQGALAGGSMTAYVLHDSGLTEIGEPVGGERTPAPDLVKRTVTSALERAGYHPADAARPAQLLIVYRWGSYNREPSGFPLLQRVSLIERAGMTGGAAFANDLLESMEAHTTDFFINRDLLTSELMGEAQHDLYFVVVSAYDWAAARQGRQELLWRTRIATMALGQEMDEAIPAMVADGAPYLGRETAKPVYEVKPAPQGQVEVGAPTVVGSSEPLPAGFTTGSGELYPIPKDKIESYPFRE